MTPDETLKRIRSLELKWRETHNSHIEEQLERCVDSFLGNFCIPMMYRWTKYTKLRHKDRDDQPHNLRLQEILNCAVKADTLNEKLIAIERCMNARHITNYFPDQLAQVSKGEKVGYHEYYENLD